MAGASSSVPSKGRPHPTNSKPSTVSSTGSELDPNTNATNTPNKGRSSPSVPVDSTSTSQAQRRPARPTPSEFLSDKATAALIRRTLCARNQADRGRNSPTPIQDLLPPLTSRNDVDLQFYALISIILREFVQNWYNKITPDETFVAEIVQIIAHCTRALEQRLRKVDLQSLLFDELPELLVAHIRAYRIATRPATRPPLEVDGHEIYHSLCPLPALSPVPRPGDQASIQAQADNESAYRQLLVRGVLAVLLPTEDLENDCLTSLVEQILSELVIGNLVAAKVSEPWLIWEGIIILTRLARKKDSPGDADGLSSQATMSQKANSRSEPANSRKRDWSVQQLFWSLVHWIFLIVGIMRFVFSLLVLSRSLPPRAHLAGVRPTEVASRDIKTEKNTQVSSHGDGASTQPLGVPLVDFHIWRCIGLILEVEARMPWLQGMLSMLQWISLRGPGRFASFNGTLDRLMSHYVHIHVLNPDRLPPLLRAIRAAVFPNNAPGVSSLKPPSSDEELAALRRRCASSVWGLVPNKVVGELYYGTIRWPWPSSAGGNVVVKADSNATMANRRMKGKSKADNGHENATNGGVTGEGEGRITTTITTATLAPLVAPLTDQSKPVDKVDATLSPSATRATRPKAKKPNDASGTFVPASASTPDLELVDKDEDEDEDEDGAEARILSEIETGIVDLFSDAYYNKHLIYSVLELVLVRLMPELAERRVGELWEERLVV